MGNIETTKYPPSEVDEAGRKSFPASETPVRTLG